MIIYLLSGAGGGALAGAATNPVDVARTRLQTQTQIIYSGMIGTLRKIFREEGIRGLGKGIGTRMIFHSLSSSISWLTYESLKQHFMS